MKKQYLILGIHNHQPIGNFDFVFEGCYQKAYAPFWEVLEKHPGIKISIHYSGTLWNWFFEKSSPLLDILTRMLHRGQVELLGGGYYEPILPILPDADKVGQIKKLSGFLKDRFNTDPRGMWLAERVWEPHLVRFIHEAGIEYLAVDDLHFRCAGLRDEGLWGYYLTEEQGKLLKVFPGSKYLRYTIPFKPPQVTIDYLLSAGKGKGNLRVMADDGEKFGVWPGTYDLVYNQGWLDQFFTLIEENHDILETVTFSEYIDRFPPLGRVYLPTATYSEMEEWALPTQTAEEFIALEKMINNTEEISQAARLFVKGGFWRNFLSKYSESNNLYRKMLWVSRQIDDCRSKVTDLQSPQGWLDEAKDELWKGQCNDAYWHGLFGGLYLPHLRDGVYNHLIQAENIIDRNLHPAGNWIDSQSVDMDSDGMEELLVKTPTLSFWLDVDMGGAITELDYRPKAFNLINSLMRRKETYHQKLLQGALMGTSDQEEGYGDGVKSIHEITVSKDTGLTELLYYDHYARNCLLDHFLAPDTALLEFSRLQHQEYGDFITGNYQQKVQSSGEHLKAILSRDGSLSIQGEHIPFRVRKLVQASADKSELAFEYQLVNMGASSVHCKFGVEFNINLLAGRSDDRYYRVPGVVLDDQQLASSGILTHVEQIQLVDEALGIIVSLDFTERPTIWRFPIETASNSECGFERVYQSSVILPHWDLSLIPQETWVCHFRLRIANYNHS
ncbi:MAG: alpha-amylase/4-alpha-glucanotransferase domain-containing protein [bacterium]